MSRCQSVSKLTPHSVAILLVQRTAVTGMASICQAKITLLPTQLTLRGVGQTAAAALAAGGMPGGAVGALTALGASMVAGGTNLDGQSLPFPAFHTWLC